MRKTFYPLVLLMMLFAIGSTNGQAFVTTWKTDNPGTFNNDQITIPTEGSGYNYAVDWGDGETDVNVTGDITHTYTLPGTYIVSITGDFPRIFFNNEGDKDKILSVDQWGNIAWSSMELAFIGCSNLDILATDAPDLSSVTNMGAMLARCTSLSTDLNHWDVSNVQQMNETFAVTNYNGNISDWDVSNVVNMTQIFTSSTFNRDISRWDMSSVTNANDMFANNSFFNQDISGWNTESFQTASGMFVRAMSFNQDLSSWDVSKVTNMLNMFFEASAFNYDLSSWDVSSVNSMRQMFNGATNFNQDLSSWDVSNVSDMTNMFNASGLSTINYDNILRSWSQLTLRNNVVFGATGVEYCKSGDERQSIIDNFSWSITDHGENCNVNIADANFKAALLANTSINTVDDGQISFQEAEAYTGVLNVSSRSITSLTGIEAFSELTGLSCSNNMISVLDLSANSALQSLNSSFNPINELDLTRNTELTNLISSNTSLHSIDLSQNSKLVGLSLDGNQIMNLDISQNTVLEEFLINSNNLVELNVAGLTSLVEIVCYDNELVSLDVSSNTSLRFLEAANNNLSELNAANGNILNFETFEVTGNPNLTCIEVDDVFYAEANFTDVDATASFSTNCVNSVPTDLLLSSTSIDENSNPLTLVAELSVIDADPADDHNFFIVSSLDKDDWRSFDIVYPEFGMPSLITTDFIPLDFETKDTFTFEINVTDNSGADYLEEVTITLNDVNDTPTGVKLSNTTIDESNPIGTLIAMLSTEDEDMGDTHTYEVFEDVCFTCRTTSNEDAKFIVIGNELRSNVVFDFEEQEEFPIGIESTDAGGLSAFHEIIITVNDLPTQVTSIGLNNASINENELAGSVIGTLSTQGEDLSGSYTYTLVSGEGDTDNAAFSIVGDQLLTAVSFDFEIENTYTIRVQTDDGNGITGQETFIIVITDVFENTTPTIVNAVADVEEQTGFDPITIDLSQVFSDMDADDLSFDAVSSNSEVVIAAIQNQDELLITEVGVGSSTLTVTADDGNGGLVFDEFVVTVSEAPLGLANEINLKIFPNPTADFIQVHSSEQISIELTDLNGRTIKTDRDSLLKLDMRSLSNGIYIVIISKDNRTVKEKIIKAN